MFQEKRELILSKIPQKQVQLDLEIPDTHPNRRIFPQTNRLTLFRANKWFKLLINKEAAKNALREFLDSRDSIFVIMEHTQQDRSLAKLCYLYWSLFWLIKFSLMQAMVFRICVIRDRH